MLSVTGSTPAQEPTAWGDPSFREIAAVLAMAMFAATRMLGGDYWESGLFVPLALAGELNRRLGTRPKSKSPWLRAGCLALVALGFTAVYYGHSPLARATGLALAFAPALLTIRTARDHPVPAP